MIFVERLGGDQSKPESFDFLQSFFARSHQNLRLQSGVWAVLF